jgi:hypothetical protein
MKLKNLKLSNYFFKILDFLYTSLFVLEFVFLKIREIYLFNFFQEISHNRNLQRKKLACAILSKSCCIVIILAYILATFF